MLRRTSLASEDFLMMTSFSRSAVCMRRTLDWFLSEDKAAGDEVKMPHAGEGADMHYFKNMV